MDPQSSERTKKGQRNAAQDGSKDREALLVFFDFTAEHWELCPIDGTLATVQDAPRPITVAT
jgi:hypothetical protein